MMVPVVGLLQPPVVFCVERRRDTLTDDGIPDNFFGRRGQVIVKPVVPYGHSCCHFCYI